MVPSIYEINSLVWLREQPWYDPKEPDLSEIPDEQVAEWAAMGFDYIWFLGVWTKGDETRRICLENDGLRRCFERILPDFTEDDVVGSPFSISAYKLSPDLGGPKTLVHLRRKLNRHGLKLMLDFVPNHLACDHRWVIEHPERFVRGTEIELDHDAGNYYRPKGNPSLVIAHGRDPYFAGWTDTAQINIASADARSALIDLMLHAASQCDALRFDMAMLLKKSVFETTWGEMSAFENSEEEMPEFWLDALSTIREHHPNFVAMAEVYWGLEHELQQMGFNYTYDKTTYDLMLHADGNNLRKHLRDTMRFQDHMVRFIENHDEERAETAFAGRHRPAAVLMAALPGPHLFHEGEFIGRRCRLPVQLNRRPVEPVVEGLADFYSQLFQIMRASSVTEGECRILEVRRAWEDNPTSHAIVTIWRQYQNQRYMFVSNIAAHQAQAYSAVPVEDMGCNVLEFRDLLSDAVYYRSRHQIMTAGLYLDMEQGQCHVFQVSPAPEGVEPDA